MSSIISPEISHGCGLSNRCKESMNIPDILYEAWLKQTSNPYIKETNPRGIINLSTAENYLSDEIMASKISSIDLQKIPSERMHYDEFIGGQSFREKLSCFLNEYMRVRHQITSENVVVVNGVASGIESLGFCICDENDAILIPAPYYAGYKKDLYKRMKVNIWPVTIKDYAETKAKNKVRGLRHRTNSPHDHRYSRENENKLAMEPEIGHRIPIDEKQSYKFISTTLRNSVEEAGLAGVNIKAIMITNPNNPTGTIYTVTELMSIIDFCYENQLHLIVDEVFMLTVYDANFINVLALDILKGKLENVHVLWGFSKDFGLSGYRCGTIISYNKRLLQSLHNLGVYSSVSNATQYIIENIFTDHQLINDVRSNNIMKLRQIRNYIIDILDYNNVKYTFPVAGFFVWFDLSDIFNVRNVYDEMDLFNLLMANGLAILPGQLFENPTSGHFRMVISHDFDLIKIAMKRLVYVLNEQKKKN